MNDKYKLTAVGSVAYDTIATPFGKVDDALGGSVIYIGAIAGLFAPTNIVGVVGDDFDMKRIDFLKKRDVNLEGLEVLEGPTFRWEGRYHRNMNIRDTLMLDLGVFQNFSPMLPQSASNAEFLLLANIDPDLQMSVLEQMKKPIFVAFDSMNHWITSKRNEIEEAIKKVNMVFMNDEELFLMTGEASAIDGAKAILEYGPSFVVVKKGEHGALLVGKNIGVFPCPAYPLVKAKDPTGAGDVFAGAMLGYLAATKDFGELNLKRAVAYGTVAASFAVEEFSTLGLEQLNIAKLNARFRKFKEMLEF